MQARRNNLDVSRYEVISHMLWTTEINSEGIDQYETRIYSKLMLFHKPIIRFFRWIKYVVELNTMFIRISCRMAPDILGNVKVRGICSAGQLIISMRIFSKNSYTFRNV